MSVRSRAPGRIAYAPVRGSRRRSPILAAIEGLEPRRLLSHFLAISNNPTVGVSVVGGAFTANADNANVNVADLVTALGNGDVTVSADTGGTQGGAIAWAAGANLNYAGATSRTLTVLASPDNTGGGLYLSGNITSTNAGLNLNLSSTAQVSVGANLSSGGGNIAITGSDLIVAAGNTVSAGAGTVSILPVIAGEPVDIGLGNQLGAMGINRVELDSLSGASINLGSVTSGEVTISAVIQHSNDSSFVITSGRDILIPAGNGWVSGHGNLTFNANQQAIPAVGNFVGISLNGSQIRSVDGQILLQGKGGSSGSGNTGIYLTNGAIVKSTGNGTVTLNGTGGNSASSPNSGVIVEGAGTQLSSTNGDTTVTGAGGGSGASSDGVDVISGAVVSTVGFARITLTGTGGSGAGSAGVRVGGAGSKLGIVNGVLTVSGTASGAAGNNGVAFGSGAAVAASGFGNILVTGVASTTETPAIFFDHATTVTSGSGNVTFTGDVIDLGDSNSITSNPGGGSVTFQPSSVSRNIVIGAISDAPGALSFTFKDLLAVGFSSGGFSSLVLGRVDGTGAVSTAASIQIIGSLTVQSGGPSGGGIAITNALSSTAGMALITGGAITDVPGVLIKGSTLKLVAQSGIGSSAAPLITQTGSMAAITATGGIFVSNTGALNLGAVDPSVLGIRDTTSGDIRIIATGSLNIATGNNGQPVIGAGNVTLQAIGAAADITIGTTGTVTSNSGTTTLLAGRDVIVGSAGAGSVNNSNSGNISVVITATRDLTLNNFGTVNAWGTGTITASAGRNFAILHTGLNGAGISSQSGTIQLSAAAGGTFTLDADNNHGLVSNASGAGANISIAADRVLLTSNDFINAGTGAVAIHPVSAGRLVDIGSATDAAVNTLELSSAELNDVASASVIRIGNATAGITISNAISLQHVNALSLFAAGTIAETALGTLTVPSLRLNSFGSLVLSNLNSVGAISSNSMQSLLFNNDGTPLAVATVDGVTGISTFNAPVEIDADTLDIQQQINAGTAVVTLKPSSVGRGVSVGSEDPTALSITDTELAQITAGLVQIGSATTGQFGVGGAITTHAGYNTLAFQSGSIIIVGSPLAVANLSMTAAANISMFNNASVGIYAAQVTSPGASITLHNALPMAIGTVGALTGVTTLGGNVNITAIGAINVNAGINAGSGTISFTPTGADVNEAAGVTIVGGSIVQVSGNTLSTYLGTVHSTSASGMNLVGKDFSFSGSVIVDAGQMTFNQSGTATTVSGVISGAGRLVLTGAGRVTLSNTNTYTGSTSLLQGTLNLTGSIGSLAGVTISGGNGAAGNPRAGILTGTGTIAGPVTIGSFSTLSGTLSIGGLLTVNAGGTVTPGSPVGIINTGGLTMTPTSTYRADIGGVAAGNTSSNHDLLAVTGDVDLGGATFVPNLTYSPQPFDVLTIVQATGNITGQFDQGTGLTMGGKQYAIVYNQHSVVLQQSANLIVTETGATIVGAGSDVSYTISVTNAGPTAATNVVVVDTPPAGQSIASYLVTQNGFPFSLAATNNNTTFTFPTVTSGSTETITVTMHLAASTPLGTVLTNSATATSDIPDLVPANNTAIFASTVVAGSADVSVAVSGPVGGGIEGVPVTFTLTVSNTGPSDAVNVTLAAPIPNGATFVSAAQTSGLPFNLLPPAVGGTGTLLATKNNFATGTSCTFTVTVLLTHPGSLTLSPTITTTTADPNGANNAASAVVVVADAPITATRLFTQPFPTEGHVFTTDLATFTDGNPLSSIGDFTTTVTWGDGSSSAAVVSEPGGAGHPYIISGTHTYAVQGGYQVHVAVSDAGGSSSAADLQMLILDAPIVATGVAVPAVKNVPFSLKTATFTDGNPLADVGGYITAINWGDGSVSNGLVQANGTGGWDVIGSHTYAAAGSSPITTTILEPGGGAIAHSSATVTNPPAITVPQARTLSATVNHSLSGVLLSFVNSTSRSTSASQYSGLINWGDGTTAKATFKLNASTGNWDVIGSHIFKKRGQYKIHVTVKAASVSVVLATYVTVS